MWVLNTAVHQNWQPLISHNYSGMYTDRESKNHEKCQSRKSVTRYDTTAKICELLRFQSATLCTSKKSWSTTNIYLPRRFEDWEDNGNLEATCFRPSTFSWRFNVGLSINSRSFRSVFSVFCNIFKSQDSALKPKKHYLNHSFYNKPKSKNTQMLELQQQNPVKPVP